MYLLFFPLCFSVYSYYVYIANLYLHYSSRIIFYFFSYFCFSFKFRSFAVMTVMFSNSDIIFFSHVPSTYVFINIIHIFSVLIPVISFYIMLRIFSLCLQYLIVFSHCLVFRCMPWFMKLTTFSRPQISLI